MGVLCENTIIGASGAAATGYTIDQSLRFNDDDSSYLSRTPGSTGDRRTLTFSAWVKRGNLDSSTNWHSIFTAYTSGGSEATIAFREDAIRIQLGPTDLKTSAVYRDTSSWYHIVFVLDTENATSGDRQKLYVNGTRVSDFSIETQPSQNLDTPFNLSGNVHRLGTSVYNSSKLFDGYLAEVNFIDGQALTPSNFGETGDYGEWKPKKYTGTYDTNGFYLDFADSADLGNDVSGEGNDWTTNNLAATDQVLDTPTNNFATLNPLIPTYDSPTLSEGNLEAVHGVSWCGDFSTWVLSSDKWYVEYLLVSGTNAKVGIISIDENLASQHPQNRTKDLWYNRDGTKRQGTTDSSYGASYAAGDIIGIALDKDGGNITFYKNGVSQGQLDLSAHNIGTDDVYIGVAGENVTNTFNFGQDSSFAGNKTAQSNTDDNGYGDFYYSPPTGYLALCTQNLDNPAVTPSEHFNPVLYTGNGSTQSITGVGFQPDWVWNKVRSRVDSNHLWDNVRGAGYRLRSDSSAAENYNGTAYLTAFDSDGFSVGLDDGVNRNSETYVAWCWKAGNATLGTGDFTQGTIASTCSRNTDAGFSIVSYTGNATNSTVGHGLSSAPDMIIVKNRDSGADSWRVGTDGIGWTKGLVLNTTAATNTSIALWNNTAPTTSVFSIGAGSSSVNENGSAHIAYCFHSVEGYSKVGSYTGNGSSDGPFIYTGFRPAYIITKRTDASSAWVIHDNKRSVYNVTEQSLYTDSSNGEVSPSTEDVDFTSNGFKIRSTTLARNSSGGAYIYIAFAETPFKYTNAR